MSAAKTPFQYGQKHFSDGMPRSANPFYIAAVNNGARKPEKRPSVIQWFAGWDLARIAKAGGAA